MMHDITSEFPAEAQRTNFGVGARDFEEQLVAVMLIRLFSLCRFVPHGAWVIVSHVYASVSLLNRSFRNRLLRVARCCNDSESYFALLRSVENNVAVKFLSCIHHFQLLRCKEARIRDQVLVGRGRSLLRAEPKRPMLILSAHYIGFEAAMLRLSVDVCGAVVVESTGVKYVDIELARCWQRFLPQIVIHARGGLRKILRTLRAKKTVALLIEHMGPHPNYIEVPLRNNTSLRMSPALRNMLNIPNTRVVWMSVSQLGGGRYSCDFDEIESTHETSSGNPNPLVDALGAVLASALPHCCWNTAPLNFRASAQAVQGTAYSH